jgi:RNA polymerase sigma-70 factor (ECF subfamily)
MSNDRYVGQSPSMDSDTELDALAAQLSERFRDRLRFFAARRLRDRDAAEDVAQEVLRRTLEALRAGKVENREALPAFLFQTARNVCMQWGRSEGRKSRAFTRLHTGGEEDPEADPLAELITEERREKVREAFERLGPGDREVLRLSYVEALGAEEIATQLNLTAGAVRVRRHRALNRLAEIMGVTKRSEREP